MGVKALKRLRVEASSKRTSISPLQRISFQRSNASIGNRDSHAVLYKAAEFLKVRSREAKTHRRRRLIKVRMRRIGDRIQSTTCRAGQPNPSRAAEVLLAADADAFPVFPSHCFGHFCRDFGRLFAR